MNKVVTKNRVYKGFLNIDVLDIELTNGKISKEEVMVRKDAAAALVYDIDNKVFVLVKQFRAGSESELVEIVAGSIDAGESPDEAIKREVLEEIGYSTESIELLHSCYMSPGGCSEKIYIYHISGRKVADGGGVDEFEEIETIKLTYEELVQFRFNFNDAKTIIAVNRITEYNG